MEEIFELLGSIPAPITVVTGCAVVAIGLLKFLFTSKNAMASVIMVGLGVVAASLPFITSGRVTTEGFEFETVFEVTGDIQQAVSANNSAISDIRAAIESLNETIGILQVANGDDRVNRDAQLRQIEETSAQLSESLSDIDRSVRISEQSIDRAVSTLEKARARTQ